MKRMLVFLVAAGVCGCSAGPLQADSVWTGSRILPGAGDDLGGYVAGEEGAEGGLQGSIIARLGMSIYTGSSDKSGTPTIDEQVDPRLTLGCGYSMMFDWGDIEVGLDLVPDGQDWFNNAYYNIRGDYIYWFGESGLAAIGGLGFFVESNTVYEEESGGDLAGSFFFHIDLGALYLIPGSDFDLRMAYQIPMGKEMNVAGVLLMSAQYAF